MAVNTPYKKSTATTTNHTANYDLPLWAGEDTTSWLTQMNDAMNKIDDGMVDAKSKALEVVGIAADAKKLADETKAESAASAKIVAGYNDRLTAAEEKIVEHTQDITNLNTRSDQFDVELHSVQEVQKKTTADLATLAAKVDTNKSDADEKITANTEAIARTDANVATLSGKVTALETEVGEVSSTTQTNTNAISAINTTIDGIKAKNTEQDEQISTINTEVSSLDSRVTALEDGGSVTVIKSKKYIDETAQLNFHQSNGSTVTATGSVTVFVNEYSDGSLIVNSLVNYVNSNGLALTNVDYVKATLSNTDIIKDFAIFKGNHWDIGSGSVVTQITYPSVKNFNGTLTCRNFTVSSASIMEEMYTSLFSTTSGTGVGLRIVLTFTMIIKVAVVDVN
nr:MAG TPA: hypothetical protein [Caudoviricetes sp.]